MSTKAILDYESMIIDFIQKKPFYIFKIDNFFNDTFYHSLQKDFPDINKFKLKNVKEYNNKFYFSSDDEIYKDIISSSSSLKILHENIFSKNFIYFFYKKLYYNFLVSRTANINSFIHLLKIPKFVASKHDILDSIIYFKIRPIIEYSYIKEEGEVVPHTDNRNKLLSLLTYFPKYNDENEFKEKEKELGTQFWFSKEKNYFNRHLKDKNIKKSFEKSSKKIYKTPFVKKTLFGFIKNQYSWHSVDQVKIQKNYIRKSINISLLVDK